MRLRIERLLVQLALLATIVVFGAPFLWILAAAFDGDDGAGISWPSRPTLSNFDVLFAELDAGVPLRNSLVVATATMALATAAVSLAGYSLSRLPFRGRTWLSYGVLLLQTMPLSSTMVPIYDLARRLELYNTYQGLILAHTAIALPFLIWLMKDFFDAVPRTLEEASWLDGASQLRTWFSVVLPVARPGIGVVAGLSFVTAWAEVLMVVILVNDPGKRTLPGLFFSEATASGGTGQVAALAVLYLLPVVILFFALRRWTGRDPIGGSRGL